MHNEKVLELDEEWSSNTVFNLDFSEINGWLLFFFQIAGISVIYLYFYLSLLFCAEDLV